MTIPSDLPQFVAAVRQGPLQALALQSGQVLDARIIGTAANGTTQVEIRGQLLNLVLPTVVKTGESIRLEVQGAGQQMRLVLQAATAPSSPASPAPAAPQPQANMPLPNPTASMPLVMPDGAPVAPQSAVTAQPAGRPIPPGTAPQVPSGTGQPPSTPVASSTSPAGPQPPPSAPASQTVPAGQATLTGQALPAGAAAPASSPVSPSPAPTATGMTTTVVSTAPAASVASSYPQSSPGLPNTLAAAAAASATTPAAPARPAAVAGAVRPLTPLAGVANATAHSTPGNAMPQPPPSQATTPQAALAQMVHASVPQQGSVTALTTALASIAGKVVLPEPVARAAQQVLAGRVAIDAPRFDGSALQAAVRGSGVFQEASLAGVQPPLAQGDMKSALLALRQTLVSWLGQQAPVAAVAPIPPPLRGTSPRARLSEPPPLDPGAPVEEVGKHLLERTESALARVRLHQHASLPDPAGRTAEWSMDLPVMVGTHQTLMQLQIHRDQHNEQDAGGERGWQMRFALNLPGMGEVGAQVSLRARSVGVMLWATDAATSTALGSEIAALRDSLAAAGLQPGAVIVRQGEPPAAPVAPSGHFLDART